MLKKAILLLVIFTIVSSNQTPYQKAFTFFKLWLLGQKIKHLWPLNSITYVKNLKVDVEVLLTSNEKILIPKCNGDKHCLQYLENAKFMNNSNYTSLNNYKGILIGKISTIIVTQSFEKEVYYFFAKSKYNGDIVQQTETVTVRKCKTVIFWTKCENHYVKRPRPLNQKEIENVNNAAQLAALDEISKKLNEIK